jgi:hypothetical protein
MSDLYLRWWSDGRILEAAWVVMIIIEVITGKIGYRDKIIRRKEAGRGFWLAITFQVLLVAPLLCDSAGFPTAGLILAILFFVAFFSLFVNLIVYLVRLRMHEHSAITIEQRAAAEATRQFFAPLREACRWPGGRAQPLSHGTYTMDDTKHIEVEMTFLPTSEGGRSGPTENGYHPQFTCDGVGWSAAHHYIGTSRVFPGETVRANLTFYTADPASLVARIGVGKEFTIEEGTRTVARGRVTDILIPAAPVRR